MKKVNVKWLKQPEDQRVCGQNAIAMIMGISLDEAIKLVGKKGGTVTKDLVAALRKSGYKCGDRCIKSKHPWPNLAIAKVRCPEWGNGWHWIVIKDYKIYDGAFGEKNGVVHWPLGFKITSLLEIKLK